MAVPYADDEYAPVFNDAIHDKVSLERMNPDRRRNLMAFARHSWVGSDEVQQGKKRGGSVRLNSFGRFVKWISASIMPPPSLVPAR